MKRVALFVLALALLASLVACGGGAQKPENSQTPEPAQDSPEQTTADATPEGGVLGVDIGNSEVEVQLPSSMFGGNASAELTDTDIENGWKTRRVNDDGSVTMTIDKGDYDKLIEEYARETAAVLDDLAGGDYPSIKEVSYSDDFSEITVVVDRAAYEAGRDASVVRNAAISTILYQAFATGTSGGGMSVTVDVKDMDTGEIFATNSYPEVSD